MTEPYNGGKGVKKRRIEPFFEACFSLVKYVQHSFDLTVSILLLDMLAR